MLELFDLFHSLHYYLHYYLQGRQLFSIALVLSVVVEALPNKVLFALTSRKSALWMANKN